MRGNSCVRKRMIGVVRTLAWRISGRVCAKPAGLACLCRHNAYISSSSPLRRPFLTCLQLAAPTMAWFGGVGLTAPSTNVSLFAPVRRLACARVGVRMLVLVKVATRRQRLHAELTRPGTCAGDSLLHHPQARKLSAVLDRSGGRSIEGQWCLEQKHQGVVSLVHTNGNDQLYLLADGFAFFGGGTRGVLVLKNDDQPQVPLSCVRPSLYLSHTSTPATHASSHTKPARVNRPQSYRH